MIPAALSAAGLGAGVSSGAFAVNVSLENTPMNLHSSGLYGMDSAISINQVHLQNGTTKQVARVAIAQAFVNDLCVSKPEVIGGIALWLKVTGGDGDTGTWESRATNLTADVAGVSGEIGLNGEVHLGQDASTVSAGALPMTGDVGNLGVDAGVADMRRVNGTVYDLNLPGNLASVSLRLSVVVGGGDPCPAPAAPTGNPPQPGTIIGTVTDQATGDPLAGVTVSVQDTVGPIGRDQTDAAGHYSINAAAGVAYRVVADHDRHHAAAWYGGSSASSAAPVTPVAGQAVGGINIAMAPCPTNSASC